MIIATTNVSVPITSGCRHVMMEDKAVLSGGLKQQPSTVRGYAKIAEASVSYEEKKRSSDPLRQLERVTMSRNLSLF